MSVRLDHANLAVRDLAGALRFLTTAFPEFRVRAQGRAWGGARWLHCGSDSVYVALHEATQSNLEAWQPYGGRPGLNHLGFEVDDVEELRARMLAAGYKDSTIPNAHPHRKRVYFADAEGNDWEFVEYTSEDPAQRNDYAIPDLA